MIIERLDNWRKMFNGPAWNKAFQELVQAVAHPEALTDGDFIIQGQDIVLKSMSYQTKPRAEGNLESHREFIDIQYVASGTELIEWFPTEGLQERAAYDAARDATFYHLPAEPGAVLTLKPGVFCVLFQRDGHAASLQTRAGAEPVKKIVIKLRANLVEDPFTWR